MALLVVIALLVLAAGWWYLSLDSPPTMSGAIALAAEWRESALAPLIALAAFVVGGVIVFPVNVLIALTMVVFGPIVGVACALLGSVASAFVVHELGRRLPASLIARVFGVRGEWLRARIVGHSLLAVAILRVLPIAPYSMVSLFSGVARIHRRDYLIGTALGMLPGICLYALFIDRARAALLNPHPLAWVGLLGAIALLVVAALITRAWQRKRDDPTKSDST